MVDVSQKEEHAQSDDLLSSEGEPTQLYILISALIIGLGFMLTRRSMSAERVSVKRRVSIED